MTRALALGLVLVAAAGARAGTLVDLFQAPVTRPVGRALAESVGRALPVTSASPGVTFTFDKATHAFERETEILGQLFLERAQPLGRGKWNLSLNYQWVRMDTIDGHDLDHLTDTRFPIVQPGTTRTFTVPRLGLDLTTHQITTSATYGVTDDLDLNLTVPLEYSTLRVFAELHDLTTGRTQRARRDGSAFGVGDVLARGKYRLVHGRWGAVAAGLVLRLPTGRQDDLQGTGDWELAPMLYAATPSVALGRGVRLQGYLNAGVDLNADAVARSEGRVGAGVDCALGERATLAVAVLGREPFQGIAAPGAFDVARVDPGTGRHFMAPVFGLERDRANTYDLSLGWRLDLWRDTLFGYFNVLLPLDREGVRADVIPLAGVEAAF